MQGRETIEHASESFDARRWLNSIDDPHRDADVLRYLHFDLGMNQHDMGRFLSCANTTIAKWMRRNGIVPRGSCNRSVEDRFWDKVPETPDGECWEWGAAATPAGYGSVWDGDRVRYAHRLSYEIHNDTELPDADFGEMQINHHCDNPACVNPDHLCLGDQSDNMRDRWERTGRSHD